MVWKALLSLTFMYFKLLRHIHWNRS